MPPLSAISAKVTLIEVVLVSRMLKEGPAAGVLGGSATIVVTILLWVVLISFTVLTINLNSLPTVRPEVTDREKEDGPRADPTWLKAPAFPSSFHTEYVVIVQAPSSPGYFHVSLTAVLLVLNTLKLAN